MTDSGMEDRVDASPGGPPPGIEPIEPSDAASEPTAQHQAIQVLTLAQRTAEEHIANARSKADKICADAHTTAEQIVREAQAHAHGLQQESEKVLADAHATAAQITQEAETRADRAQQTAEEILSDTRARADEMAKAAQEEADDLMHRAQQRYEDVVGSLAAKRETLQRQIEALEQFDREYRARLTAFMQSQLRALWVDNPHVSAEVIEQRDIQATIMPTPAEPSHPEPSHAEQL